VFVSHSFTRSVYIVSVHVCTCIYVPLVYIYKLRVKIHKITPTTGKEIGDLQIKDYVVLQKPQEHDDRLPSPRTLILHFTLTHTSYGSSHVHTTGQLTNKRRSDDDPEFDGDLREVDRKKILHYRQLYINCPDPIVLLPLQLILQVDYTMTSVVYYS
jgi:hypothetical protein